MSIDINIMAFTFILLICVAIGMVLTVYPTGSLAKKNKTLYRVCFGTTSALLAILLVCGIVKARNGPVVTSKVEVTSSQQEFPACSVTLEQVGTTTVALCGGKVIKAYPTSIVNNTCTTDITGRITKADSIQITEEQASMRKNVDFLFMTLYYDEDPQTTSGTIS